MNSSPLSYDSSKSVLKHMEANKRFLLASRCSSIRRADRATPLNIDTFSYSDKSFKVNNTEYKIGVYKKYLNGAETPPQAREDNDAGGADYELDQYGFVDFCEENTPTPGDIDLRKYYFKDWIIDQDDSLIPFFEDDLMENRNNFAALKAVGFKNVEEENKLNNDIKNAVAVLQRFYSRRDGLPVPFKSYIQLTITTANGEPYIERLEYNKKLHEAVKYLTGKFIGNRLHPVAIGYFCAYGELMRFPVGLRMDVKSLVVSNIHNVQEILPPLLTNTVQRVHAVVESAGDFECEIVKNAEILDLQDGISVIDPSIVINLTNLKANLILWRWTVEDFMEVVRNWVEVVEKKVGTSYKFTIILEESVTQPLIESIKEQYEEAKEVGVLYVLCMFLA
ncbi:hypothetical protein CRE_12014 [Caenorhabditis remanei]|uniref:Uncharacterized protein n=1 Tax=Caenorhabditis remanei TaxID=31234 RepID=E3MPR7_CAERE|nr:hypothetical protein CRE_12014 [Caenorhabditis remanei]